MDTNSKSIGPFAVSLGAHGPLGEVHLRLEDRFNTVYGKNGAGKTWLLRSLHHALSGFKDNHPAWVHYRMNDKLLDEVDPYYDAVQSALLEGLQTETYEPTFESSYLPVEKGTPVSPMRKAMSAVLYQLRDIDKKKPFFGELQNSCLFSLRPMGNGEHRWRVYASIIPTSDTPALNAMIEYRKSVQSQRKRSDEVSKKIRDLRESGDDEKARALLYEWFNDKDDLEDWKRRMAELGTNYEAWMILDEALDALPALMDRHLPIPLVPICDLRLTHGFSIFVNEVDPDLESRTLGILTASVNSIVEAMSDSEVYLTSEAREEVEELSRQASANVRTALGVGAPVLRCRIPGWRSGEALVWEASVDEGGTWFRFGSLGSGHRRWVTTATQLAILDYESDVIGKLGTGFFPDWQSILLIDEPEAGLHPKAQQAAFEGLAHLARRLTVLAATHSAIPFGRTDVRLWYLHLSDEGPSVLTPTDDRIGELLAGYGTTATSLGLDAASALQSVAVFLLVEGEHDAAVVHELIGDDLRRLRVSCLAIRGTKALGAASVAMLLQFSDAILCFALDNNKRDLVGRCWDSALKEARKDNRSGAIHSLEPLMKSGTTEQSFLGGVCLQAIKQGYHERLRVTGWNVPDVIYLLPVSSFLPNYQSWQEVDSLRARGENIKDTVKRLRGAPVSTFEVRRIAQGIDSGAGIGAAELVRLRDFLQAL